MNSLFYIIIVDLIAGFASATVLTGSVIAQGDIQSTEPSSLNMTGNSMTRGEGDIPTANTTGICLSCWDSNFR
jgi:hypothetical protein